MEWSFQLGGLGHDEIWQGFVVLDIGQVPTRDHKKGPMRSRAWKCALVIVLLGTISTGCRDSVTGPHVGTIVLKAVDDSLSVSETTQLYVAVVNVDGDTLRAETVTFASSNQDVITVNSAGLVTAVGAGAATITARVGDRAESIAIYVRRDASLDVGAVVLSPAFLMVARGGRGLVYVTFLDKAGTLIPWTPSLGYVGFGCGTGWYPSTIYPDYCWTAGEEAFANIRRVGNVGVVEGVSYVLGPEPIWAYYPAKNPRLLSNTVWLTTR